MKKRKGAFGAEQLLIGISRGGTIMALILLVVFFSVLRPDTFPTANNVKTMLDQAAVLAMIAGGLTIVLVLSDFDLSIGYTASLTGVAVGGLLGDGTGIVLGIVISLGIGLAAGLLNGLLVAYGKLNAFIATLGTGAVFEGVILWASNEGESQRIPESANAFVEIGQGKVLGIPNPVIIAGVSILILWFILNKTKAGRLIDATGGNPEAARLSGIAVNRYRLMGFALAGLFAGAAGILLTAEQGAGFATSGSSLLLEAFTACFLGAVTLRENEFHILGTVVGVLILTVTFVGLAQLSVPIYWQDIAQGGILIISVSINVVVSRLQPILYARRLTRPNVAESADLEKSSTETGVKV